MKRRLIVVYNAKAGLLAGVMDSVHKIVSPSTYACRLCAFTYGPIGMRRQWRTFLDGLGMELVFHHRPDFREAFPAAARWPLPLLAVEEDGKLDQLISAADLAAMPDLAALIGATRAQLGPAG